MVDKIIHDQNSSVELALAWAVSAKNYLSNVFGYSPNQLVFGKNPSLPSVLTDEPSALENVTSSQVVANHLNAISATRKAIVEAESSDKLKRALARKIRPATSLIYEVGDKVYHKRRQSDKWRVPGSVIGKEKHQVFVKHGGIYVRVNPCHLRHVNEHNQLNNDTTVSVGAEDSRTINQKENNAETVKKKGRLYAFDEASDDDDDVEEAEISEGNEGELVDGNDQEEVLDNLAEEHPQKVRQKVELFYDNSQEEEPSNIDQMEQRTIDECMTQMGKSYNL